MKLLLKLIPWICWLMTAWRFFLVFVAVSSGLLAGQLNNAQVQAIIIKLTLIAFGFTVVSILVHVLCFRYRRKIENI